jgi:hypothetical protein
MRLLRLGTFAVACGALALLAGCGGSHKSSATTATASSSSSTTRPSARTSTTSPSALQAEAASAATGDIPDNQVFITFHGATYSMKYPEGWAQRGTGAHVTFRDKNNIVRVLVASAAPPTAGGIRAGLAALHGLHLRSGPQSMTIGGGRAFKIVYTTASAPNPVTGKRVTLMVDRYYLPRAGKEAIVDLGTPVGVDNVDAYRMMIQSFRWR